MTRIRLMTAEGAAIEVDAADGAVLLHVAQDAGLPLEGTCDGGIACGTCHVVIDAADWPRLPPASEDEEDMLDLVSDTRRTSRLSCQIRVSAAIDGLTATVANR